MRERERERVHGSGAPYRMCVYVSDSQQEKEEEELPIRPSIHFLRPLSPQVPPPSFLPRVFTERDRDPTRDEEIPLHNPICVCACVCVTTKNRALSIHFISPPLPISRLNLSFRRRHRSLKRDLAAHWGARERASLLLLLLLLASQSRQASRANNKRTTAAAAAHGAVCFCAKIFANTGRNQCKDCLPETNFTV